MRPGLIRFPVLISALVIAVCAAPGGSAGEIITPLRARGYAVLPAPQKVEVKAGTVVVGSGWKVQADGVEVSDIAVKQTVETLVDLPARGKGTIRLAVRAKAVASGTEPLCDGQAYRLTVAPGQVEIVGNSPAAVFYGVQTLRQLLEGDGQRPGVLPVGTITDWPRYALRVAHWCTACHQDRVATLKRYLDWAARFKLNAISFDLEDKFAYPSHPIIGAPGAFTTEQMQELTRYGLQRHVQIIPNVQAPAHMSYVLKHKQFAHLRCDGNNYMACMDKPEARKLIFEMYQDMIDATPGVKYFHVSVDELYYAGICEKYRKPYNLVNRSLTYVDFVKAAHAYLAERGRRMLIWAESPLRTEHVKLLPPDTIDAIIGGGDDFIREENKRGIRQLAYASMQGVEQLFPNYFGYTDGRGARRPGRLSQAYETCSPRGKAAKGRPLGVFAAAWDNSGLHNETYWLGWAAMAQNGWSPEAATVEQTVADFMDLYYGRRAVGMAEIYRDLQDASRFYEHAWDRVASKTLPKRYGNSKGKRPMPRSDLTISPPGLPKLPDLTARGSFREKYARALAEVPRRLLDNRRLAARLQENLTRVKRNRYNLEVLLSIVHFQRHFLQMLAALASAEALIADAAKAHKDGKHARAVTLLNRARKKVEHINGDLYATFGKLKQVWQGSQLPRNSAPGKKFLHVLDDVKDYFAHRRADLTYLIAPEERIGLKKWVEDLRERTAAYARQH